MVIAEEMTRCGAFLCFVVPCERREPYRVIYQQGHAANTAHTIKSCGYESLRSPRPDERNENYFVI